MIHPAASGKTEAFITGPASDFTQRWRDRTHSWRHASEGGFSSSRYEVATIEAAAAKAFVQQHHYSGSLTSSLQRYGLYQGESLVGVAVLSNGGFKKVLRNAFPDLEPYTESLELGRLVLLDEVPANAESWFLAEAFRQAAARGVRGIVSFSDPMARYDAQGKMTMPGHVGVIYQASNARYTGRATSRTVHMFPNGHVFNAQDMQKIRDQAQGHEYAERMLCSWGAKPRKTRQKPAAWLAQALAATATPVVHPGNHRYQFTLGNPSHSKRQRRLAPPVTVGFPSLPYPKQEYAA